METKRIEKMETWLIWKKRIIEKGYKLWQTQYGPNEPEGVIVGFMRDDKRLEIVTHNPAVAEDIIKSRL